MAFCILYVESGIDDAQQGRAVTHGLSLSLRVDVAAFAGQRSRLSDLCVYVSSCVQCVCVSTGLLSSCRGALSTCQRSHIPLASCRARVTTLRQTTKPMEHILLFAYSLLYTVNIAMSNASLQLVTLSFHQVGCVGVSCVHRSAQLTALANHRRCVHSIRCVLRYSILEWSAGRPLCSPRSP